MSGTGWNTGIGTKEENVGRVRNSDRLLTGGLALRLGLLLLEDYDNRL